MYTFFVSVGLILLIIVFLSVFVFLCLWMWSIFVSAMPFIPVDESVLPSLHRALALGEESVVYDLGSGDGRILFYLSKKSPRSRLVGIENNKFPLLLSHIRLWWHARQTGNTVEIIDADFFAHDISSATHVCMYLYPAVMDELLPLLDEQLKPGTRLVSIAFQFTHKRPIAEIDLSRSRYARAHKLYVYEF